MGRVRVPVALLVWLVIGVVVAINKGYDNFEVAGRDDADMVGRFVLAVVLWPIPALGGGVDLYF